jgi:DNA-directed RNA polymerase specialized sigma24 family protein
MVPPQDLEDLRQEACVLALEAAAEWRPWPNAGTLGHLVSFALGRAAGRLRARRREAEVQSQESLVDLLGLDWLLVLDPSQDASQVVEEVEDWLNEPGHRALAQELLRPMAEDGELQDDEIILQILALLRREAEEEREWRPPLPEPFGIYEEPDPARDPDPGLERESPRPWQATLPDRFKDLVGQAERLARGRDNMRRIALRLAREGQVEATPAALALVDALKYIHQSEREVRAQAARWLTEELGISFSDASQLTGFDWDPVEREEIPLWPSQEALAWAWEKLRADCPPHILAGIEALVNTAQPRAAQAARRREREKWYVEEVLGLPPGTSPVRKAGAKTSSAPASQQQARVGA